MKRTTYGQKGGEGPTAGKRATVYEVTFPDGAVIRKRSFKDHGETAIATAAAPVHADQKTIVVVWADQPAWEGDYGRLVARRVS